MEGTTTTAVDTVIASAGDVLDLTGTILTAIVENPVLAFMLGAAFVTIGIGVFKKLKKAIK